MVKDELRLIIPNPHEGDIFRTITQSTASDRVNSGSCNASQCKA
ncbi:hypothetical protein OGM63_29450 [Plectonema radiosum NIES-515]|uniref:Uncharacterized protein n=1 Tax=Plectonema radiosum NIES-515 TaxID=2986073 RepID=A0ABT3B889_9CYAN|nr:hypothetical protein [Plectonema radiosum]MCV3217588.1 hypothetical protein [Plectonema radiosum NIES-515]